MNTKLVSVLCLIAVFQEVYLLDIIEDVIDFVRCKEPNPVAKLYKHTESDKILLGNGSDADLNPALQTYFITHGWLESSEVPVYVEIADALLKQTESNVILVDYGVLADQRYYCAPEIVELAGQFLGKFIVDAYQNGKVDLANVYLIGHSLGSHVSGIAGKEVYRLTDEKVRRISGLDPAGPLFAVPVDLRLGSSLAPGDAIFVDALHTSILIGTVERMGTVDVYAKGLIGSTIQYPCIAAPEIICSHTVSKNYYLESVSSCGMMAKNTKNSSLVAPYGYHMPEDISGVFTFTPNMFSPYGKDDPECK